jgi:uncharacterized protein (DUF1330 family)
MSAYALAQFAIRDRERYDRYARAFMDVLRRYDGRLLVAEESPDTLEGSWPYDKVVLLRFADRATLDRWAGSAEYRRIAADRRAATDGVVLTFQGVDAPPLDRRPMGYPATRATPNRES